MSSRNISEDSPNKPNSSFGGFLEGYSTSRISSLETSIKFHLFESARLLEELEINLKGMEGNEGRKSTILELLKTARGILSQPGDILPRLNAYGEALRALVLPYGEPIRNQPLLSGKLKTVIFHFMTVAKISEDSRLISLALHIGNSFNRV